MKIIITGASAGFGEAIAWKFAPQNELWLVARRNDKLEILKRDLEEKFNTSVRISVLDVRDKNAVIELGKEVTAAWGEVDLLINNAGLALGMSPIQEGNTDDWDTMIDTNIKGLLYITRAISPIMVEQKRGHIINIGSTAGKLVYANGNVYSSTKFAVDALSQSMRIDLLPYNIKVTAINPGMANTEFSYVRFKGNQQKAENVYKGYAPLLAEDIADIAFYCANLPAHVCINDLTVTPTQQANSIYKLAQG